MRRWHRYPSKGKGLWFYYETTFKPARLARTNRHTEYRYVYALMQFDTFLGRAAKLSDLTDEKVAQAGAWLVREHGLSVGTEAKFRDCMASLWRFLARRRLVDQEPTLDKLRPPVRTPTAWNAQELSRLWEYLQRLPGELCGVPANVWFMSLHAVLWDTGERIGAILTTRWTDVDLTGGWIVIRAEQRKGGLADKLSKLHPETVELLRLGAAPQRELVWPWPANRYNLWRIYKDILRRAGLPHGRMDSFHKMRKSVASWAKRYGGNPQEVLGHYDPRMTETVYIDERICPKQHAADVLPRLYRLGEEGKKDAG